jgi:hypothetical protein
VIKKSIAERISWEFGTDSKTKGPKSLLLTAAIWGVKARCSMPPTATVGVRRAIASPGNRDFKARGITSLEARESRRGDWTSKRKG